MTKSKLLKAALFLILADPLLFSAAYGQDRISWSIVDAGGNSRTSTNFRVADDSLSYDTIGTHQSPNFSAHWGFIQLFPSPSPSTPTGTPTKTPTNTLTSTPSSTSSSTPSLTATATVILTATFTNSPSTTASSTGTSTPTSTMTATPTNSFVNTPSMTPTATPSSTASSTATALATGTNSATMTFTRTTTATFSSTSTSTRTATATKTMTATATLTATVTPTPQGAGFLVQLKSGVISNITNSPHPFIRVVNTSSSVLNLGNVEVRYWFNCDCTNQTLQVFVDWAGKITAGTNVTADVQAKVVSTTKGGQTNYISYIFNGLSLKPGEALEVDSRFNKSDFSNMIQSNDWSFAPNGNFTTSTLVTGYVNGQLAWGQEPDSTGALAVAARRQSVSVEGSATATSVAERETSTPTLGSGSPFEPVLYPNPARGSQVSLMIPSTLDGPGDVKVRIFTTGYREVREWNFSNVEPGSSLALDLLDKTGASLSNGLYYLLVTTPTGDRAVVKLLVLR